MINHNSFIDTNLILQAITYYQQFYTPVAAPLCVDKSSVFHTLPINNPSIKPLARNNNDGFYYAGSAEQSFINLYNEGLIQEGAYMALTPCQRDEFEDDIHFSIFLKMELIIIGKHDRDIVLSLSHKFFNQYSDNIDIVPSGNKPHELDILINNIEVGSYGINQMADGIPYTYGTGIAEPRLSYALHYKKDSSK